jgi:hypothetical protein
MLRLTASNIAPRLSPLAPTFVQKKYLATKSLFDRQRTARGAERHLTV